MKLTLYAVGRDYGKALQGSGQIASQKAVRQARPLLLLQTDPVGESLAFEMAQNRAVTGKDNRVLRPRAENWRHRSPKQTTDALPPKKQVMRKGSRQSVND